MENVTKVDYHAAGVGLGHKLLVTPPRVKESEAVHLDQVVDLTVPAARLTRVE